MMESSTHSHDQNQRGYSLAEVLVATAIFTIIFVAALMIYDRSNKVFKNSVEAGDLQQQVRVSFDRLVADVRMAGFDFDRDGIPSGAQRYQQPDEQLEYIGPRAITIRGNLDAEIDAANENGREQAYQPLGGQFPVVTTANDEIVTYALKSVNGPNNDKIEFWADTRKPRKTYPGGGGADEQKVTISGVNLCTGGCLNPPYTLYRITLRDADLSNPSAATDFVFTPVADNIRSIRFTYYQDHRATNVVTPNGGEGQYLVSSAMTAATALARALRENVNAIRVEIVGMNAAPTYAYLSPVEAALPAAEQVASARSFRQYQLQSVVVPRNIGLRGMQEFDTNPPSAPKVLTACAAGCGVAKVTWEAPATGIVDSYAVLYDTSPTGSFSSTPLDYGQALEGHVQGLDPTKTYYFVVVAQNSHGSQRSINTSPAVTPINPTKPDKPVIVTASGQPSGPAMLENAIEVKYTLPNANVAPYNTACGGPAPVIPLPVKGEMTGYQIYRSEDPTVPAVAANLIWPAPATPPTTLVAPSVDNAGNGTFVDNSSMATCRPYYYRFIGVEQACSTTPALNTPADTTVALSVPSEASLAGKATTNAVPEKASIVNFVGSSSCSADPCSIELQWPQVVKDVNGKAIWAPEYVVRRETATAAGPIAGTETTMTATDTNFADNVAGYIDAPPQPAPGVFYRYSVAARQTGGASCTTPLTGAYSDPRNFPCIQMEIAPPTLGWIDGDGSLGNPWLIAAPWGSVGVKATLPITTVTGHLYDMAGTLIATVPGTLTGTDTAVLDVPLTSNNGATYRFAITVSDASGCSNTDSRYMTDAVTACCLAPYKMTGGTVFDSTIISAVGSSGDTFDVKLRNLCDDALTLKAVRISWPTLANPALEWVAFPPAIGTLPVTVVSGSLVTPTTILVPATALTTVGGGTATYLVRIKFTKTISGGKDAAALTVTPIYDRAAASETNTSCRVVQTPF